MTDINSITPYEKNAKVHPKKQIEQVANSIKEFGFNQPIVADKGGVVIVGHGRLMAAKLLGLEKVPVITVDLSEEKAKSYRLADNKLNESNWDMDLVIPELKVIGEELIDLTGFSKALILPGSDDFSLPDNDKGDLEQITFTLNHAQAEIVRDAMNKAFENGQVEIEIKTSGNKNKNGNAITCIARAYHE